MIMIMKKYNNNSSSKQKIRTKFKLQKCNTKLRKNNKKNFDKKYKQNKSKLKLRKLQMLKKLNIKLKILKKILNQI